VPNGPPGRDVRRVRGSRTAPQPGVMGVFALLADGTAAEIRPARPDDYEAVRAMHAAMSPDNTYLRFFDPSPRTADREARRVCRPADGRHAALLAWLGGELAGVASYERTPKPGVAEIAFAVPDHLHGRGVATLLLEHLVSLARRDDLAAFTAETLAANSAMLGVFTDAGLPVRRRVDQGMVEFTLTLPAGEPGFRLDPYLSALDFRESHANAESLRPLLLPRSVAVVGAGRRQAAHGREIVRRIVAAGFRGAVYAVMPGLPEIAGAHHVPSVADLPEPVDLAVLTVPADRVLPVAARCGQRGARALVVTTVGLDGAQRAGLLQLSRWHGMRLAGPGSFGVAAPGTGLDATFAAPALVPGRAGLVTQSGGLGYALAGQLSRLGIGVSSLASVGGEADVSAHDMLLWWEQDGLTALAVLLLESFTSPRKLARAARRVSRTMPVLTVDPDWAGATRAAPGAARAGREALFEQAGIISAHGLDDLLGTAAFLATQPAVPGRRVAILADAADAAASAADACAAAGLLVHRPAESLQRQLREVAPAGSGVTGPVCTTGPVAPEVFRRCLELTAAGGADAVLVLVSPPATAGDLAGAVIAAAPGMPVAAVLPGQAEAVRLLRAPGTPPDAPREARQVPAYAHPEGAARALAAAVRHAAWAARPRGGIPEFADLRPARARALVRDFLAQAPAGGRLSPAGTGELLACYGLPLAGDPRPGGGEAGQAAVPAAGTGGIGVSISVVQDPVFGAMVALRRDVPDGQRVSLGLGSGGPGGSAARMTPLTDADADDLIQAIRLPAPDRAAADGAARAGPPGPPEAGPPGRQALREALLRVSRLADDLPQVAGLQLRPVLITPDAVVPQHAEVRLVPAQAQDPFLRRLR